MNRDEFVRELALSCPPMRRPLPVLSLLFPFLVSLSGEVRAAGISLSPQAAPILASTEIAQGNTGRDTAQMSTAKVVNAIESAWATCGRRLELTDSLSRAARAAQTGTPLSAAMKAQGFTHLQAMSWNFTYHGDTAFVARKLGQECRQLSTMNRYGLFTDGREMVLIVAQEAKVDLAQKSRWLEEFLTLTNRARAQARTCGTKSMPAAGPLRWDDRLSAAAQGHVNDLIRLNFRGHVNPQTGTHPQERAQAAGFRGRGVGENLAYNMVTPQDAVQELLGSPLHCENLMNAQWSLFGAGVGNGNTQTLFATYWAQLFGMP